MDPNPKKNEKIEENKSLMSQMEKNENYNNKDINLINKKRKEPIEEKNEENLNILKEIEIVNHEIEEKKKTKIKLQKELDEINSEIYNGYEKIQNLYLKILNINETKNIRNENKGDLFSLNQNIKRFATPYNALDKLLNSKTVLETILPKSENKNSDNKCLNEEEKSPFCVDTSIVFKTLRKNKFLNMETINNNIKENENNINNSNILQEYSFRCLTDNLDIKAIKGTKEASIKIELENNGKSRWPENDIFLLADEDNSTIERKKKIRLYPLEPKGKCSVNIQFNLDGLMPGIYKNCLSFIAKGRKFGNNITINIKIY